MITHQNWTRLLAITLIFLGYGGITSEVSHLTDLETSTFSHTFDTSAVFSEDPESSEQPLFNGNNSLHIKIKLNHLVNTNVITLAPPLYKHNPYKPRAPPIAV